ncbi:MAG: hypothetical protein JOZ10_17780, partial [Acidobacteria bacterium]|nr:hypothetical protein [Acidobacteriota bacterium]
MSPRFSSFFGRVLLAVVTLFAGVAAVAQTTPAPANPQPSSSSSDESSPSRVDVFAGYSYLSPNGAINGNKGIPAGFTIASSYWFNKYLGAALETGSHFGDINTFNTLTFGPTFRVP